MLDKTDDNLPFVRDLLDNVVPARISDNIMGELYAKLIINSCINSLGVIVGVRLGKLLANRKVRRIFIALMRKAMAVAVPVNAAVVTMIRQIEAGTRKMGLANLDDAAFKGM